MIHKKLLILIMVTVFATAVHAKNDDEYLSGFEAGHYQGINQLQREFEQSMSGSNKVQFKNYMVVLDVGDVPAHKIFLLKNYGFLEGVNPITLNTNVLVFNSYERKADALFLAQKLNQNYRLDKNSKKVEIAENIDPSKTYEKAPFIYRDLFQNMTDQIKKGVTAKVYVVEPVNSLVKKEETMPTRIMTRKPETEQQRSTQSIIERIEKNEAMSSNTNKEEQKPKAEQSSKVFTPKYTQISALAYDGVLESFSNKKWKESLFIDSKTKLKQGQRYSFAKSIVTDRGVTYYKILDKNLWVDAEDVNIIGGKN